MDEINLVTRNKIDEVIDFADQDPELKELLQWLDKTDKFSPDIDFYQRVILVLAKRDADEKARAWKLVKTLQDYKRKNKIE